MKAYKEYWPVALLIFVFFFGAMAVHEGWRIPQQVWVMAVLAVVLVGVFQLSPGAQREKRRHERFLQRPMARRLKP